MTLRIATVPGTPLLIPAVASGAAADLADVRRASLGRVAWAAGEGGLIAVFAQHPAATQVSRVALPECISLRPLGLAECLCDGVDHDEDEVALPVAVIVAAWLAATAGVRIDSVWVMPSDPDLVHTSLDAALVDLAGVDGLVLIADGSSTRTPKAPGSLVDGAVEFDDQLIASVAGVDVDFLTAPERRLDAARFEVQGLGAWAAAAQVTVSLPGSWTGEVDIATDPFGVCYLVAGWTLTT